MVRGRPQRSRPNKPSYGASSSSSEDSDKKMGESNVGKSFRTERELNDHMQGRSPATGKKISVKATDAFAENRKYTSGNTRVRVEDGKTKFILYDTIIAEKDANDIVELNTGGYRTHTTKERMNSILSTVGGRIVQQKGVWYYVSPSGDKTPYKENLRIFFNARHGMTGEVSAIPQ